MIQIAICDDDRIIREETKKYLWKYFFGSKVDISISEYENGTSLLDEYKDFHLILMDYEFQNDKRDGIMTAKEIRKRNQDVTIIFLSSHPAMVYDSFSVGTFRFLTKPIDEEKWNEAMASFIKTFETDIAIQFRVRSGQRFVYENQITYIEGDGKYSIVHLNNGEIFESMETLAMNEQKLSKSCFCRCHKSFLVNMKYVMSYNKSKISMRDGAWIDISKNKSKEFQMKYLEYIANN